MLRTLCAFAAAMLAATGAGAAELMPGNGHSLGLGGYTGVVYYTVEPGGYRVVATVAEGETGTPMRFLAVLTEGQAVAISVPGKVGQADQLVEIARVGNRLLVDREPDSNEVAAVSTQVADR
jgi:hypothetical protein